MYINISYLHEENIDVLDLGAHCDSPCDRRSQSRQTLGPVVPQLTEAYANLLTVAGIYVLPPMFLELSSNSSHILHTIPLTNK